MNAIYHSTRFALLCILFLASTNHATAQLSVEDWAEGVGSTYRIKLTAAAEPIPAFKHRLTYLPHETIAANAATNYLRSFGDRALSNPMDRARKQFGDSFEEWGSNSSVPIEDLPKTKAKEAAAYFDNYIENHIARASKCRTCEWGLGFEDIRGPDVIGFLLPSVQETRSISRVLALKTRVAISEKRFRDAVQLMRMNYQLGINVNKMDIIVTSLVAIAEVGITNETMLDFISTPGSPNMYWALSELPRPIVDVRNGLRQDVTMATRIFPELFTAEEIQRSPEEWKSVIERIAKSTVETQSMARGDFSNSQETVNALTELDEVPTPNQLLFRLAPTAAGILTYSAAKRRLADSGIPLERIESLPVAQVIFIDAGREYTKLADNSEKYFYLPFSVATEGMDRMEDGLRQAEKQALNSPGAALAAMLLPATRQVHMAATRVQRDIDALRVIEAIRMHAAETGVLPKSLGDISIVPVPVNPATGKPFQYSLIDGTATLELPRGDGIVYSKRFEIRL